jgi:hypothetical protein
VGAGFGVRAPARIPCRLEHSAWSSGARDVFGEGAELSKRNLLLSREAVGNSNPQLRIFAAEVEEKVAAVAGVTSVTVDLVWEPPRDWDKMSEAARLELGLL